jgi:maltose alpha-D-glucosyltransferase/alpha-amylase
MFDGDAARVRMAYSLMLSLPGAPVIRYGEEIGMGDDLSLPERTAVRTPMQWSDKKNAGFTASDEPIRPVIDRGPFRYQNVNVDRQRREPDSLLMWMERAIRARKEADVFGRGDWHVVDTDHEAVFAHVCERDGVAVAAVHNLGDGEADVTLDLSLYADRTALDLLDPGDDAPPIEDGTLAVTLPRYGFRWFRLERER